MSKKILYNTAKLFQRGHFSLPFSKPCKNVIFFYSTNTEQKKWSYFSGIGKDPLLGMTVGQLLDETVERFGENEAVVFCHSNIRKTYNEFKYDIEKFAAGLIAIGLKKGDRIGIWSPNYYEWILTQFAAAKAGLILVNVNPAYQPRELEFSLKKVGIRALVAAETFKTQNYYEMLKNIMPSISTSSPGQIKDKLEDFSHLIMISEKKFGGAFKFWDVVNAGQNAHFAELQNLNNLIQFDDPVNIQFTSGTTGNPKGATLSHFNIVNNGYLICKNMRYLEKSHRICLPVPLYHCFGCVIGAMAALKAGACMVFPAPSFNAQATAEAITKEKCTTLYGTPTMFIDVLNLADTQRYNFSSLSAGIMAGSTCPIEVLKACTTKLNITDMCVCYGATEISPIVTQTLPDTPNSKRATTVGTVLEHTEVKLVDPATLQLVPIGETGELWARGYMVMLGYWNEVEKTEEAITPSRWYRTGDLAVADDEGYIQIIGRIKDMIIRGGENIYPREIEEFFHTHPKIAEAHIVGVPDQRMGEELCAWIRLKSGETLTEHEVKEFCKGQLSHFKVPRYIKFVDSFPMTVTGKIQKFILRERATKELNLK